MALSAATGKRAGLVVQSDQPSTDFVVRGYVNRQEDFAPTKSWKPPLCILEENEERPTAVRQGDLHSHSPPCEPLPHRRGEEVFLTVP